MKKLKIYMHISENSGVGFYRQYLPAIALRESGLADVRINDFRWGLGNHVEITEKVFFEQCNWADIIVVGRMDRPEYYAKWGAVKQFFNMPIIMDTDDNIHHVRPSNPGYQGYHPGSEAKMWNEYAMNKVFDAITVTTQSLKEFYSEYHPKIYILPNNLDIKEWKKYKRKKHKDIRMTFICSGAHAEGFGIIQKPVYDILRKYKNVTFYYPEIYWKLFTGVPEDVKGQIKQTKWIKLKEWPKKVKEYSFDIGLAPLADNYFNRSKSNLRYLEFSMAGMASILSPVSPYLCVNDGVDGILAKERNEWYNAMERLVVDEDYRYIIAKNAEDRVAKEFDVWKNAKVWYNTYKEVHDKYHAFYGEKKQFVDIGKGQYKEVVERKL